MAALLSWFYKCNNQDHLQLPELRQPQFHNIGLLCWPPISLVSSLLSSYDCSQPASYQLLLSLGSLYLLIVVLSLFVVLARLRLVVLSLLDFLLPFFSIFCSYNTLDCSQS